MPLASPAVLQSQSPVCRVQAAGPRPSPAAKPNQQSKENEDADKRRETLHSFVPDVQHVVILVRPVAPCQFNGRDRSILTDVEQVVLLAGVGQ